MTQSVELIVAVARNGVIGGQNKMLWHVPEDFRHFKTVTMGLPVVMGRKNFESIGRPLPGRRNVVLTRRTDWRHEGVEVVHDWEEEKALLADAPRLMVIGGGELYRQTLSEADVLWLTEMDRDFEGDTSFPDFDRSDWTEELLSELPPDEKRDFSVRFKKFTRNPAG